MSTFDERESAFENKFAHDAEMQFKAEARTNKLLGLWAAEILGHEGEARLAVPFVVPGRQVAEHGLVADAHVGVG